MTKLQKNSVQQGFTIVELLIVIVVIAILASVTIVSYTGIITRAHQSKLISDVASVGMLMGVEQSSTGTYPLDRAEVNNGKGISNDTDITYNFYSTLTTFCISAVSSHGGVETYYVSNKNLSPLQGSCPQDMGSTVATLAGSGAAGFADGAGTDAVLFGPAGIVADPTGNLYFTDGATSRIRMVTPSGVVSTIAGAGGSSYAEGSGTGALFNWPQAITFGPSDKLYVTDTNNNRVRSVTTAGVSGFVAGSTQGYSEGTGSAAKFNVARGIVYDPNQSRVLVADSQGNRIRQISSSGVVSTFAGQTSGGFVNGTGSAAKFNYPQGLDVDSTGNVYVADTLSHSVRKITPAGVVTTLAGGGTTSWGQAGYVDANGTTARFRNPMGVAVDAVGNVYVADSANNLIRKIATNGDVTTVAGTGTTGSQNGIGTDATFSAPRDLAIGSDGRLYVTDNGNNLIRVISNY